jgi:glutathione S-transferase
VGDGAESKIVAGLRYAFPRAMRERERAFRRLGALHDAVAARPRIAAYLTSSRRVPFNEQGIFRHYLELDRPPGTRKRAGAARPQKLKV